MVDVAPTQTVKSAASPGDLALVAHRGDRGVLLAMDLPQERTDRLAGFALYRKTPGGVERPLLNRLDFATPVTSATTPAERRWHPSDKAPFQKFRWVDMPSPVEAGTYRYTATARYFGGTGGLVDGPSAFVDIDLADEHLGALTIGFTRGYISSQAYADRFHNAPFEPDPPTVDFDTTPYRAQYQWLGFHARELVMSFLADCQSDLSVTLDVFAFDLNEPDVIRMMAGFGSRLRLYLDNSPTHVDHADKPKARPAMEPQAQKAIEATGGAVKTGHFGSLAHDKVLIARRNGTPFRVLTGSANFSVRGLYVQSNNVLVFESAEVAGLYGLAFDQAWQNAPGFRNSAVARAMVSAPRRNSAGRTRGFLAPLRSCRLAVADRGFAQWGEVVRSVRGHGPLRRRAGSPDATRHRGPFRHLLVRHHPDDQGLRAVQARFQAGNPNPVCVPVGPRAGAIQQRVGRRVWAGDPP